MDKESREAGYARAGTAWGPEDDLKLKEMALAKRDLLEMAVELQRQPSGITMRLRKLGLEEKPPEMPQISAPEIAPEWTFDEKLGYNVPKCR